MVDVEDEEEDEEQVLSELDPEEGLLVLCFRYNCVLTNIHRREKRVLRR